MIGETLGQKYELLRLLGKGGMGSVYEARHIGTGEHIAVKLINGTLLQLSRDALSRFRREARAIGAVDSEHIVRVLDSGADEATDVHYLAMEFLQGEDLQRVIKRVGPLPPEVVLRIASQALDGLQKAHAAGVIHRDIKPANLFLMQRGGGSLILKLLDFGIAKIVSGAQQDANISVAGLTTAGSFLGSPLYMSPEQVRSSSKVDQRTDLWSLGASLYCAMAGYAPHQNASSVGELLVNICTTLPAPLSEVAPWVPPEIARVVNAMLQPEPHERYPNAAAALEALRPLLPNGDELREGMLVGLPAEVRALAVGLPSDTMPIGGEADISGEGELPTWGAPLTTVDLARGDAARTTGSAARTTGSAARTTGSAARTTGPGPRVAPQGAPRRSNLLRIVGAAVAIGLGGALAYQLAPVTVRRAATAEPQPKPPEPPVAAAARPSAEPRPPEPSLRVALGVAPDGVEVEVDGAPAEVREGNVGIAGRPGSVHAVRLSRGGIEKTVTVTVTEVGVEPPKVELVAPPEAGAVQSPLAAATARRKVAPPRTAASKKARDPVDNGLIKEFQ